MALENREALIKELKDNGRIPVNFPDASITDEKLLDLSLNPNLSGNPTHLKMEDITAMINDSTNKALANYDVKSKEDLKKLPSFEVTDDEVSELKLTARGDADLTRLKNNLIVRKFLNVVILDPSGFKKNLALNTEASGSVGGYTVPIEFEGAIAQLLVKYGKFRANCTVRGMNSKTLTKPRLLTGVTANWTGENSAVTETNPTFEQITYTRHKLDAVSGMTLELLQDTGSDLMGELSLLFAQAFGKEEDIQGFAGTGSPITGIFNTAGINTTPTATTNFVTSMNRAILLECMGKIADEAEDGAKWFMKRNTLFNVIAALVDDVNRPLFDVNKIPYSLFGHEIVTVPTFNAPTITTPDTDMILFGNLQWATLRQRIGMYMRMSDTATIGGNSGFEKDLMWFKPSESLDIQVEIPSAFSVITNKIS